jgi:serine phosphatase RsbU (regulator of sigma subunit)
VPGLTVVQEPMSKRQRSDPFGRALESTRLLGVVAVLVFVTLLVASLALARLSFARAEDERQTADAARISGVSVDLVLALQSERGLAAGVDSDPQLDVLLVDARADTDRRLEHAEETWRQVADDLPPRVRAEVEGALDVRPRIDGIRAAVGPDDVPADVSAAYAGPILDVVDAVSFPTNVVGDADDVRTRFALVALLDVIEATGNARGVLLPVFARDEPMDDETLRTLSETIGAQRTELERFRRYVDESSDDSDGASPQVQALAATDRLVDVAIDRAAVGDYGIEPEAWHEATTEAMDGLALEAKRLNEALLDGAEDAEAAATRRARLLLAGCVATLVLALVLGAVAASSTRRRRAAEREIRTIAETLQRSLLPSGFPERPEIEVHGRCEASGEHALVGGDWYDVFDLGSDCVGLVIGDVTGHGVEAMAAMARLRYSFETEAYDRTDPSVVMQRMQDLLTNRSGDGQPVFTTVFYGVLDLSDGRLTYTSAGHPPPVVLDARGATCLLEESRGVILGTGLAPTYDASTTRLAVGETLVLYTDGLVERRREPIDRGIHRLRRALERHRGSLDDLERRVFDALPSAGGRDDAALLLLRYVRPVPLGERAGDAARVERDDAR